LILLNTTLNAMRILRFLPIALTLASLMAWPQARAADDVKKLTADVKEAIEAFENADAGLKRLFRSAPGYVVFPSVGKGGFVFGGAHGSGLVYAKGTLVGRATLTAVTVGAQIGGQSFSEVIFFETEGALAQFKESRLEMSAQVSAVAVAEGASKNAKYVEGVMVFTKARSGLMAEASIGGQKFKFEAVTE
jgi:lipid-binding SYLF domain-containing protein